MTAQGDRQASVRAVTLTALDYNGDWSALFDVAVIAKGDFNSRFLAWINQRLESAYTEINGAMQALAVANGAVNFSSMGTFAVSGGGSALVNVDFTVATPESAGATVSRASVGYGQTVAGGLTSFAANASRQTNKGVLVEGARTNVLTQTQDLSNAAWTQLNVGTTANQTAAPDGTVTASKVAASGSNAEHGVYQGTAANIGTAYVFSVYFKASGYNFGVLHTSLFDGSYTNYSINLSTGAVDFVGGTASLSVTPAANGFWKATVVGVCATGAPLLVVETSNVAVTTNSISFAGDGVSGFYGWQPNLQTGAFDSSTIPATGAAATRAADNIAFALATPSGDYAITLGLTTTRATAATRTVFDFNDGTDNNKVLLEMDATNHLKLTVINAGVPTVIATEGGTPAAARSSTAVVARSGGNWSLTVDTVLAASAAAASPAATSFALGRNRAATSFFDDFLTKLKVQ
jgi:hypothetical protein